MVSKFDETLPILRGKARKGRRLGACAMGPVAPGDKLTWMRVWVWQLNGKKIAVSSGTSGEHLGGPRRTPREKLPFTPAKGWMIQTELEPGSEQFAKGKAALATALAIVEHDDGSTGVEHWSQAVKMRDLRASDYS
jgi:hypothetical protein